MVNVTINVNNSWNNAAEESVVELSCFCIPNYATYFGDFVSCQQDWQKRRLQLLGIPAPAGDDDLMIQVWLHDKEHDNLTDHGIPDAMCKKLGAQHKELDGELYYQEYAPSVIPLSVLKDVKEGDTLTFTAPSGAKVRITFSQEGRRYSEFGDFAKCVYKAIHGIHG